MLKKSSDAAAKERLGGESLHSKLRWNRCWKRLSGTPFSRQISFPRQVPTLPSFHKEKNQTSKSTAQTTSVPTSFSTTTRIWPIATLPIQKQFAGVRHSTFRERMCWFLAAEMVESSTIFAIFRRPSQRWVFSSFWGLCSLVHWNDRHWWNGHESLRKTHESYLRRCYG